MAGCSGVRYGSHNGVGIMAESEAAGQRYSNLNAWSGRDASAAGRDLTITHGRVITEDAARLGRLTPHAGAEWIAGRLQEGTDRMQFFEHGVVTIRNGIAEVWLRDLGSP